MPSSPTHKRLLTDAVFVLRGGFGFFPVLFGAMFGFMLGTIPGFNLTSLLLLLALVFLNTNLLVSLAYYILGIACGALFGEQFASLGYWLVHDTGLSGIVSYVTNTPLLALLNWQVYEVFGALVASITVGTPLAILTACYCSRKLSKGEDADRALMSHSRIVVGLCVAALLVLMQHMFLEAALHRALQQTLSEAAGSEVEIDRLAFSPKNGIIGIYGLRVPDPQKPYNNIIDSPEVVADLDMHALLRKQFVFQHVQVKGMQLNTRREYAGIKPEKKAASARDGVIAKEHIEGGLEIVKRFNDQLGDMRHYLTKQQHHAPTDAARANATPYSAQQQLTQQPSWVVQEAKIHSLVIKPELPRLTLTLYNLASQPELHDDAFDYVVALEGFNTDILNKVIKKDAIKSLKGTLAP